MADIHPPTNSFFSLEIDGTEVAEFTELSGLKSTAEVFEIIEGGFNGSTHKRVGQSRYENLTLRNFVTESVRMLEWRDRFLQDQFDERLRTTGAIVLRDLAGNELRRWSFGLCWPVSWEGPTLNSGSSDMATETLEIAFDSLKVDVDHPEPPELDEPPEPVEPEDPPGIVVTDDEIVTMEPIQFEYDSAELTDEGQETVDDLAETLNNHEEIEDVYVEGHTCDLGSSSYNLRLSIDRARTVYDELRAKAPGKNYHYAGYGYDYPVAPNNNESNRSKNRRTQLFQTPRSGKRDGEIDYEYYNSHR